MKFTLIISIGMLLSITLNAQTNKPLANTIKEELTDPVCKMKINTKSSTNVNYVYEKVTYTFCSATCKKNFISKPLKYLKKN